MERNKDSKTSESVHCSVCNVFIDCNAYNLHIKGKKHKKNVYKSRKPVEKPKEPLVCQPQFIFEELAPLEIQFMSFLNQVLLSREECIHTTLKILQDLEPCLTREFGSCWPYVFGSMATGLALIGSDVDIFLDTGIYNRLLTSPNPKEDLKRAVTRCARALRTDRRFVQIIPISMARVPIVKLLHQPTGVSCDISFKDSLGVHNSQLLKFYLSLNPRFFEVMVAIKFWAKECDFCKCDSISSYGWTLLFISFLQTLKWPNGDRPVYSVYNLQKEFQPPPWSLVNGYRVDFHPKYHFVQLPNEPQFSYFGLLKGFFSYYKNFAFEENIVCPYLGQPISWASVISDDANALPPEFQRFHNEMKIYFVTKSSPRHCVSIQDPFQHDFLLGGSCSSKSYEKILKGLNAATEVCETEEQLADSNASKFLTSLFTSRPHEREDKFKIKLRNIPSVKKEVFCEHVFIMLENIFTKVMKLELKLQSEACLRRRGEPESKVVKKTETQDVHQLNDMPMEKKYHCAAVHPVWCFRKKSRKEVKLAYPETAFEFETKLSDVIVKHNYPSERIEFSCDVQLNQSFVLGLILRQTDKHHNINDLFEFLRNNLPVWINTFLGEEFHETAVLARVLSEPCTSIDDSKIDAEGEGSENGDVVRSCSESGTTCEDSNSSLEVMDQKQNGAEQDS